MQLHNLPVEFWEGETLKTIAGQFGTLLKVDDFMTSLSQSKYARICVGIDLSKSLSQGFWIGDDLHRVFVVVLYERLLTFCYTCGMIGHGSNSCSRSTTASVTRTTSSHREWRVEIGLSLVSAIQNQRMDDSDPLPDPHSSDFSENAVQSPRTRILAPGFWFLAGATTFVVAEAVHVLAM